MTETLRHSVGYIEELEITSSTTQAELMAAKESVGSLNGEMAKMVEHNRMLTEKVGFYEGGSESFTAVSMKELLEVNRQMGKQQYVISLEIEKRMEASSSQSSSFMMETCICSVADAEPNHIFSCCRKSVCMACATRLKVGNKRCPFCNTHPWQTSTLTCLVRK